MKTPIPPDDYSIPPGIYHVSASLDAVLERLHLILSAPEMRPERTELHGVCARLEAVLVRHNGRVRDADRPREMGGGA